MKNSIKYILPICALFFASCEDFLKEEPKSFLSPDNFYQTMGHLLVGLNGEQI